MQACFQQLLASVLMTTLALYFPGRASADSKVERPQCGLDRGSPHTVSRVLDGETVALDDGTELRLIGALAPRALDAGVEPGQWPAEISAMEELRALLVGKSIELGFGGERVDRYGRHQAHAYVHDGEELRWVQGYLLEQGLARAYVVAGNRSCAIALLAAEKSAREAGRGLWAEAAYRVRSADKPRQLLAVRSSFQLVEGTIASVAQVRGMVYLNFAADWRHTFSVALRRTDRELLGADAGNPKTLEGKRVRVRGWIEQRTGTANGPTIELSTGGLLEVVEPSSGKTIPDRAENPGGVERNPTGERKTQPPGLIETGR